MGLEKLTFDEITQMSQNNLFKRENFDPHSAIASCDFYASLELSM